MDHCGRNSVARTVVDKEVCVIVQEETMLEVLDLCKCKQSRPSNYRVQGEIIEVFPRMTFLSPFFAGNTSVWNNVPTETAMDCSSQNFVERGTEIFAESSPIPMSHCKF